MTSAMAWSPSAARVQVSVVKAAEMFEMDGTVGGGSLGGAGVGGVGLGAGTGDVAGTERQTATILRTPPMVAPTLPTMQKRLRVARRFCKNLRILPGFCFAVHCCPSEA